MELQQKRPVKDRYIPQTLRHYHPCLARTVLGELWDWATVKRVAGRAQSEHLTALCTVFLDMFLILKRQYFFCEVPFESGAQKESDLLFLSFLLLLLCFSPSTSVICDIAAWIITSGSTVWLSENIMKLLLPFLPCFLLQCACLFNLWNWQERDTRYNFMHNSIASCFYQRKKKVYTNRFNSVFLLQEY